MSPCRYLVSPSVIRAPVCVMLYAVMELIDSAIAPAGKL